VIAPGGETSIAVNAPLLPAQRMTATSAESAGVEREPLPPRTWDFWRWLVLLAIVALWLEWWLYYSSRARQQTVEIREFPGNDAVPGSAGFDRETQEPEQSELRKPNFVA
jgi:hypothetical protein